MPVNAETDTTMQRTRTTSFASVLVAAAAGLLFVPYAAGQLTLTIVPTSAPFFPDSPNFDGTPAAGDWQSNAMTALQTNQLTLGSGSRSTNPARYEAITNGTIDHKDMIGTGAISGSAGFPSWRGVAVDASNPTFGAERGNRLHYGLKVISQGGTAGTTALVTDFTLSSLTYSLTATDRATPTTGSVGTSYSIRRVGVWWGADKIKGTADDVTYTSGSGLQLVNELYYIGVGDSFQVDQTPTSLVDRQIVIDDVTDYVRARLPFTVGASYAVSGTRNGVTQSYSAATSLTVTVPEPATAGLLGLAVLPLLRRPRRESTKH